MADDAAPSGRKDAVGNLDALSVEELTALSEQINAKRRDKVEQARAGLMAEFQSKAAALGLKFEGRLVDAPAAATSSGKKRVAASGAGATLPVKFKGPSGEEWSGRGRLPRWLQALEATGRKRDEFQV